MAGMNSPRLIRVLVVDDSAFVRKVVKQMLLRSPFVEVVGTARDGQEALELAEQHKPDVITLDLIMPGMDAAAPLRTETKSGAFVSPNFFPNSFSNTATFS